MPSALALEDFVSLIESGRTLESMQRYYRDDAQVRENMTEPRVGKVALLKHEQDALATVKQMRATCVRPILSSGDIAVLRWVFEIEDMKGKIVRFEELAYQRWQDDMIHEEQFFYDPAQFK